MNPRALAPLAPLAPLAVALALAACDDPSSPSSPSAPAAELSVPWDGIASLVTHNFPAIQFGSGITNDSFQWYVSTLSGFRPTYIIDPATSMITGTTPGSANPRDLVWMWPTSLAYSDEGRFIEIRSTFSGAVTDVVPIPWRGGGIARWRDTLYVGNQDADSILVIHYSTLFPGAPHPVIRKFPTPMRPEGLVIDSTPVVPSTATLWGVTPFDKYLYNIDLLGNLIQKCAIPYDPGPFGLGGVSIHRDSFLVAHPTGGDPLLGTTIHRIDRSELVCFAPSTYRDTIDIEPGRFPNRINPRSGAPVQVAVLTTPARDASTLVFATVRFGRTGTEAAPLSSTLVDVDGDGDIDALFRFRSNATGILCGDVTARLTANATVGPPFDASDLIQTFGCRP